MGTATSIRVKTAASIATTIENGRAHLAAAQAAYDDGVLAAARHSARLAMRHAESVVAAGHRSGAADSLARRAQHILAGIDAQKARA